MPRKTGPPFVQRRVKGQFAIRANTQQDFNQQGPHELLHSPQECLRGTLQGAQGQELFPQLSVSIGAEDSAAGEVEEGKGLGYQI